MLTKICKKHCVLLRRSEWEKQKQTGGCCPVKLSVPIPFNGINKSDLVDDAEDDSRYSSMGTLMMTMLLKMVLNFTVMMMMGGRQVI